MRNHDLQSPAHYCNFAPYKPPSVPIIQICYSLLLYCSRSLSLFLFHTLQFEMWSHGGTAIEHGFTLYSTAGRENELYDCDLSSAKSRASFEGCMYMPSEVSHVCKGPSHISWHFLSVYMSYRTIMSHSAKSCRLLAMSTLSLSDTNVTCDAKDRRLIKWRDDQIRKFRELGARKARFESPRHLSSSLHFSSKVLLSKLLETFLLSLPPYSVFSDSTSTRLIRDPVFCIFIWPSGCTEADRTAGLPFRTWARRWVYSSKQKNKFRILQLLLETEISIFLQLFSRLYVWMLWVCPSWCQYEVLKWRMEYL